MKSGFAIVGAVLVGAFAGAATAAVKGGLVGDSSLSAVDGINVDGWKSDWAIGSSAADPYTRAMVARRGLLALAKEEAVYFTTVTDSGGEPLRESCRYELTGGNYPGDWWSITLYDQKSRLPMNDDNALSIDATSAEGVPWRSVIAATRPTTGHWISSKNGGAFDLTLRIYKPTEALLRAPEETLTPPTVTLLDCGAAS